VEAEIWPVRPEDGEHVVRHAPRLLVGVVDGAAE
jgi:hypothetical protein